MVSEDPDGRAPTGFSELPSVLNLREAAALMRMHTNTVRTLVLQGKLPASKVGRGWRFLSSDLIEVIRDGYRRDGCAREIPAAFQGGRGAFDVRPAAAEAAERELDLLLARSRR